MGGNMKLEACDSVKKDHDGYSHIDSYTETKIDQRLSKHKVKDGSYNRSEEYGVTKIHWKQVTSIKSDILYGLLSPIGSAIRAGVYRDEADAYFDSNTGYMITKTTADYLKNANRAYNEKRYQDAADYYQSAYVSTPSSDKDHEARYLNNKGNALYCLGKYQEAISEYETAYSKKSDSAYKNNKALALNELGTQAYNEKRYQDAADYYQSAYVSTPSSDKDHEALYLNNKGNALYNLGKYQEAISEYEAAYSKKSDSAYKNNKANALNALGTQAYNSKDYSTAVKYYQDAHMSTNDNE
jgi:tetratricopeptide (TPR) repeat protein